MLLVHRLHLRTQPMKAASQVRHAGRNPDPRPRRQPDHERGSLAPHGQRLDNAAIERDPYLAPQFDMNRTPAKVNRVHASNTGRLRTTRVRDIITGTSSRGARAKVDQ